MRTLIRLCLQYLVVVVAALAALPAEAGSSALGIRSGVDCIPIVDPSLEELSRDLHQAIALTPWSGTSRAWAKRDARSFLLKSILETKTPQADLVVTVSPRYEGPRRFGQPSGFSLNTFVRWNPAASIDPDSPSFIARWGRETVTDVGDWYRLLRKDSVLYEQLSDRAGEQLGALYFDHDFIPKPMQVIGETMVSTDVTLLANAIAFGPNLILMPESVARSPAYLAHGAFRLTRARSGKEAALSVAEIAGAIGTIAGAIGTAATVFEMRNVATGRVPPAKTGAIHEYASTSPYVDDPESEDSADPE